MKLPVHMGSISLVGEAISTLYFFPHEIKNYHIKGQVGTQRRLNQSILPIIFVFAKKPVFCRIMSTSSLKRVASTLKYLYILAIILGVFYVTLILSGTFRLEASILIIIRIKEVKLLNGHELFCISI